MVHLPPDQLRDLRDGHAGMLPVAGYVSIQ